MPKRRPSRWLTDTQRKFLLSKGRETEPRKADKYYHIKRNARQAINDLTLAATNLPDKYKKEIFTPDLMLPLIRGIFKIDYKNLERDRIPTKFSDETLEPPTGPWYRLFRNIHDLMMIYRMRINIYNALKDTATVDNWVLWDPLQIKEHKNYLEEIALHHIKYYKKQLQILGEYPDSLKKLEKTRK